jgi:endo-1,3(4)-beta-glucanase
MPSTPTDTVIADNIFVPIQKDDVLSSIPISQQHPVARKGILDEDTCTIHTNSFYANAFLGNQNQPIWTHPYSIRWGKGVVQDGYFANTGMNISHAEMDDLWYGPGDPVKVLTPIIK